MQAQDTLMSATIQKNHENVNVVTTRSHEVTEDEEEREKNMII